MLAEEAEAESDMLARQRQALENCLAKLDPPQRELLAAAYQPGVRFHEVATRAGKSAAGFYKVIQRLRSTLLDCVQRQMQAEGAT